MQLQTPLKTTEQSFPPHPINHIPYSLFPTEFFYLKRLVMKDDLKPLPDLSKANINDNFVEIFINPSCLDYPLIDSILNFQGKLKDVELSFEKFEKYKDAQNHQKRLEIYTSRFTGDIGKLLALHDLGLYQPKYEEGSYRGGQRFLFRQTNFAEKFHRAIKTSLMEIHPTAINNVFRYNFFESTDKPFYQHYDVPYVDMTKTQMSKYAIIIYLTGGESDQPVLQIEGVKFNKLQPGQCIIFSHQYIHKGSPFKLSNKIFLRSELVFTIPPETLRYSLEAANWFNRACYISKNSILDPTLKAFSARCFQQYCRNRYKLSGDNPHVFLHKKQKLYFNDIEIKNLEFITDGNDYYFSDKVKDKICAAVVVWDYFKGKGTDIKDKYYVGQNEQKQYENMFNSYLSKYSNEPARVDSSCQQTSYINISDKQLPATLSQPYCNRQSQRPTSQYYPEIFSTLQTSCANSSMQLLDNHLLTISDLIREEDLIYFNSSNLERFNFASCECDPRFNEYIKEFYGQRAARKKYRLPYMRTYKVQNMTKINIDLFKNGFWLIDQEKQAESFQTQVTVGYKKMKKRY